MNSRERSVGKILEQSLRLFSKPSPEWMESAGKRALQRIGSADSVEYPEGAPDFEIVSPMRKPRWFAFAAAAVVIILGISMLTNLRKGSAAELEIADVHRMIRYGKIVRATDAKGALLSLKDGSQVEMRVQSELLLEHAKDGVQIRLNRGDVIVTAAKQHTGHLYVRTKDVTVSVVGTVFLVKAGEDGSRIAVIQGEVHVQQNGEEKKLLPGEQASSNPLMKSEPVSTEIAWSRQAEEHLAVLQQLTAPPPVPEDRRIAFEETSVKPANPSSGAGRGARGGGMSIMPSGCGGNYPIQIDPARFAVSGTTLHTLITWAYGKGPINYDSCLNLSAQNVISGGPGWIRSDLWDIEATVPGGSLSFTSAQLKQGDVPKLRMMLRALLKDRFNVAIQNETKEVSAYALTAEKGAPRLTIPAGVGSLFANDSPGILREIGLIYVKNASITDFIPELERQTTRPVLDRTGLIGTYTFWVEYTPLNYSGRIPLTGPPILAALQEQVGLKLEPIKTNVEIWVVERAEKPSPN